MTEVVTADGPRDLRSLTGLRAPAALLVYASHSAFFAADHVPGYQVAYLGYVGVPLFFALSGIVLAWSSPVVIAPRLFLWRRFTRIYPLHLVATLLALAVFTQQSSLPLVGSFLLVHAWWPPWHGAGNSVSWTLSCEAFFYAIFPWAVLRLRRLTERDQWCVGLGLFVAAGIVLVLGTVLGGGGLDDALHWHPLANVPTFLVGVVIGIRLRAGWRPAVSVKTAWAVTAGCSLPVVVLRLLAEGRQETGLVVTIITPAFILLLVAYAAQDLAYVPTFFSRSSVVYAGQASFAFYLVHLTVIGLVTRTWGVEPSGIVSAVGLVVALLVASSLAAVALHEWVEGPARRALLKATSRQRASVRASQRR